MPKFTDTKILDYLERPNFKDRPIAEWLESMYDHEASSDPKELALERAYFSKKRAEEPRLDGLERVHDMERKLLEVLVRMEER